MRQPQNPVVSKLFVQLHRQNSVGNSSIFWKHHEMSIVGSLECAGAGNFSVEAPVMVCPEYASRYKHLGLDLDVRPKQI